MPTLIFFLPCDRFIEGKDGTISLITVLENLEWSIPESAFAALPEDAALPLVWNAVSVFDIEEEESGKQFEQKVTLTKPDGEIATEAITAFAQDTPKKRVRNVVRITGFPAIPRGTLSLSLALRAANTEDEWRVISEYPITVNAKGVATSVE